MSTTGKGYRRLVAIGATVVVFAAIAFMASPLLSEHWSSFARTENLVGYEALTGSRYLPLPPNPYSPPQVRELQVPFFAGAVSVWGATGRDPNGNIWVGVSATSYGTSARLLQYSPKFDTWSDRGSALQELKSAGLSKDGTGQTKIHTKIVPAMDGRLYFASTDEEGEDAPSGRLPRWGGHLWRIDPRNGKWQHLLAVAEGLVAVGGVGRYIYALGYWNHVLYQYDVLTGASKRVVVGSIEGHVSRNFIADERGHVYVPRLRRPSPEVAFAELVEYDSDLREVTTTALESYFNGPPEMNHGITALAYLANGNIAFTTHRGQLYLVQPNVGGAARVVALGWFNPEGESYAPCLFSTDGGSLVVGVTERRGRYEWIVFDLATGISGAFPLDTLSLRDVLLYGSITRDDNGRFYVAGWAADGAGGHRPLMMQITAP